MELVEGATVGNGFGYEEGICDRPPALLFLPGEKRSCGYAMLSDYFSLVPFAASLAAAEPMSSPVPNSVASEVLQVERAIANGDTINGSMRTVLDDHGVTVGQPLAQAKAV